MSKRLKLWLSGTLAAAPLVPGIGAAGILYGAASIDAGVAPSTVILTSSLVATGTAQFIALELLAEGHPWALIVLVGLLVNLRFAVYSVHMAEMPAALPRWRRWLYRGLITDEGYALTLGRKEEVDEEPGDLLRWSAALMLLVWLAWLVGGGLGALLGAVLPTSRLLELAVPLSLLCVLVLMITSRRHVIVAATAATVALLLHSAPFGIGLLAAIGVGVGVGSVRRKTTRPQPRVH